MRLTTHLLRPAALLALAAGGPSQAADESALMVLRNDSGRDWWFLLTGHGRGLDPAHGSVRVVTLLVNGTSRTATYPAGSAQKIELPAKSRVAFRFTENDDENIIGGNLVEAKDAMLADFYPLILEPNRLRLLEEGPFRVDSDRELVLLGPSCGCAIL